MRLYLTDVNKVHIFDLPLKVDGSFLFFFKDIKTHTDNTLSVEEKDNKWQLKSNGNVNIVINNQIVIKVNNIICFACHLMIKMS